MNEPWAIESILNGTGGGGGGGNPIPPITNVYVPVEAWQYQDRIIDVVGFPWVADVPYPNVKASDFVSVIFGQEDAESGIFSNVCDSRTDAVRIFASEKPSKRVRIDTLSGFRPNASNSIWGNITGDIQTQQDLIDLIETSGGSNSDWDEDDVTKKSAILNRPFKTIGEGLTVTEGVLSATGGGGEVSEKVVYVSEFGSDTTGDGTQENPWREINYAFHHALDDGSTAHTIIASIIGNSVTFNEAISLNMSGRTGRDYVIRMDGMSQITLNGYIETADNLTFRCDHLEQGSVSQFIIGIPDGLGLITGIMLADGAKLTTINDYESNVLLIIMNQGPAEVAGTPISAILVHRGSFVLGTVGTMNACGITTRIIDDACRFDNIMAQGVAPEWGINISKPSSGSDHPNVILGGEISGFANSYEFDAGASSLLSIGGKWVNQT